MNNQIVIKRKKRTNQSEVFMNNFVQWVEYWRKNPHRFITDYLGLKLYDFQKILIYQMNFYNNFIFIASRGLAKSTLTLLFALQRCILYPNQKICVVTPNKEQSSRFISKAREFMQESSNLMAEIKGGMNGIHTTSQNTRIDFSNGSKIFAVVYGEGALGKLNLYISNLLYNKSKRRKV